jgi:hypothetical protein
VTARDAFEASLKYQAQFEKERQHILQDKDKDCARGMHAWLPDNQRSSMPKESDAMCMVNYFTPNANDKSLMPKWSNDSKAIACSPMGFENYACSNWYSDYEAEVAISGEDLPTRGQTPTKKQLEHAFHTSRAFSQLAYMNKQLLDDVVTMVSTYSPLGWSADGKYSPLGGDHEEGYFRRLVTACINSTLAPTVVSTTTHDTPNATLSRQLPGDIQVFWDMAMELGQALTFTQHEGDALSRDIGHAFGRAQCLGISPIIRVKATSHFMDRTLPVLMVEPQLPLMSSPASEEQVELLQLYCSLISTMPEYAFSVRGPAKARDECIQRMEGLALEMNGFMSSNGKRHSAHEEALHFFQNDFWTGFITGMSDTSAMARSREFESSRAIRGCLSPEAADAILSLSPGDTLWTVPDFLQHGSNGALMFYNNAFSSANPSVSVEPETWKMLLYIGLVADYLEYTDHVRLASYVTPLYEQMYGHDLVTGRHHNYAKHRSHRGAGVNVTTLGRGEWSLEHWSVTPWMQGHARVCYHLKDKDKDMRLGHYAKTRPGDGNWHGKAYSWVTSHLKKLAMLGVTGHYEYGNPRSLNKEQRDHLISPQRGQLERQEDSAKWETCSKLAALYLPSTIDDAFASMSLTRRDVERVTQVTQKVLDALIASLQSSTVLTPNARNKLVQKAQSIAIRVAVPWGNDRVPPNHDAMGIKGISLWQDTCSIRIYNTQNNLNSAFGPISSRKERRDKMMYQNGGVDHFGMPTSAVNAYYSPIENSISILAGIMGPPFYDKSYTMESMLGTIGAVIGHELSHAFDSTGVHFDPMGSYVPSGKPEQDDLVLLLEAETGLTTRKQQQSQWLDDADMDAYEDREQCFIRKYNMTTRMGNQVNSVQTLGENIADTMGIRAALDALVTFVRETSDDTDVLPSQTQLQEFIESYAQIWCVNKNVMSELLQIETDPHSPGGTRINGAISSLFFSPLHGGGDPLHIAYGCTDRRGDKKRKQTGVEACALW